MANLQVGVAGNGTVTVGSGASVHSPSNNVLTLGTNNSERFRIDASGRLLIGTTTEGSTTAQDITINNSGNGGITIRNGTSSNGNIYFSDATSGSGEYKGYIQYRHNGDKLVLGASATEKVHITSTGLEVFTGNGAGAADPGYGIKVFGGTNHRDYPGIYMEGSTGGDNSSIWAKYNLTLGCDRTDGISGRQVAFANGSDQIAAFSVDGLLFGSDTAAANALDDYEEGNYTPTFNGGSSGSYSLNSSYDNLAYTKIGRQVTVTGRVRMSAKNAASGSYIHMSLPTTSADLSEDMGRVGGLVVVQSSGSAINSFVTHPTTKNNSYVQIGIVDGTGFGDANAQFSGDELVFVSITYQSA